MHSSNETVNQVERVPNWLVGLWRRQSITLPDGSVDDSSYVYWAQSEREFIDIRVSASRPHLQDASDLSSVKLEELLALTEQKGFSGHTHLVGNSCTWQRHIDYQPNTGRPDTGTVYVDGDTLIEKGGASSVVGSSYREVYNRVVRGAQVCAVLEREDGQSSPDGWPLPAATLVILDDWFMFARDRFKQLPRAETLTELVSREFKLNARNAYLMADCEISLGHISGLSPCGRVELSTVPMREQQPLFPEGVASPLSEDRIEIFSNRQKMRWRVSRSNVSTSTLAGILS